MPEHILSPSYGKDSLACLGAIEQLGWPLRCGQWCNRDLKLPALRAANKNSGIYYIGIASDEPGRFHNLSDTKKSPLVEAGSSG